MTDMDLFREFLESSTIHGVSYISTAKVDSILIPKLLLHFLLSDTNWKGALESCDTSVFLVVFSPDLRILR